MGIIKHLLHTNRQRGLVFFVGKGDMTCVVFVLVTKMNVLKLTISEQRRMTKIIPPKGTFILLPSVLVYGVHSAQLLYLYSNSNMAHNTRPVFVFIMLPPHGQFCIKSDLYVTLDYMFILVLLICVKLSRTLHHKCNVTTINDLDIFITHHYRSSYPCHHISSFLHRRGHLSSLFPNMTYSCPHICLICAFTCLKYQIENVIKLISMTQWNKYEVQIIIMDVFHVNLLHVTNSYP